jgi:hypothetical protein
MTEIEKVSCWLRILLYLLLAVTWFHVGLFVFLFVKGQI